MTGIPLPSSHLDFLLLRPLAAKLLELAGGPERFALEVPQILRKAIDEVIDAPRTNRFTLSDVEKTEKTYLGTKVEILLRASLSLPRGQVLDLSLDGVETDIKNTMGGNWTIPIEAIGHPCLLLKENEKAAVCSVGMIIAKGEYLNPGKNRDSKRSFSTTGLTNVWWLLKNHPYPPNFWESVPVELRKSIMAPRGGATRLAILFRNFLKRPISRSIVQGIGQQDDYMKRIRRNGGARDLLAPEGVAVLWGQQDKAIIKKLGLGPVGADEFISYRAETQHDIELLRNAGHID